MTTILTESSIETVAGGFAGFCQVLVGHPFDTIKVINLEFKLGQIVISSCQSIIRSECKHSQLQKLSLITF